MTSSELLCATPCDLWVANKSLAAGGEVHTPRYSRLAKGVPVNLQPVSAQRRLFSGVDMTLEMRHAFLPSTLETLPDFTILVETATRRSARAEGRRRPRAWRVMGPGDFYPALSDGTGAHWEVMVGEQQELPDEIARRYYSVG